MQNGLVFGLCWKQIRIVFVDFVRLLFGLESVDACLFFSDLVCHMD